MGNRVNSAWIYALPLVLAAVFLAQSREASAVQPSALSRWLSKQAVPQLRERLGRHPRYENQRIVVVNAQGDALSSAVVTVLLRSFPGKYGVQLLAWEQNTARVNVAISAIDGLHCTEPRDYDYLLQVSAKRVGSAGEVQLRLSPAQDNSLIVDNWHWTGKFTKYELGYVQRQAQLGLRNGSLAAPWRESDAEAAARLLSHEFACALRPQLNTRLALAWNAPALAPGVLSDTVNISRHLLANYRELGVAAGDGETAGAAYVVDVRLVPLRDNIWQLWLMGAPRAPGLAPVQAVTYFSVAAVQAQLKPAADPLDYLDVELLDTTQSDSRGATAALRLTLQLANHAQWPLDYSFTLSGGHFLHCIASPGYYRHDRYGSLAGQLAPGQSVVRELVIEGAEHRPTPIFGTRKCAGIRDLVSFEEFARQGYKVTDYVRWHL